MKTKQYKINLQRFADNTNVTTQTDLSAEMKTFYSDYLIDLAEPNLVHDQFGQKKNIPKNGGKTIEFRKYDPLPKALTPLTEGVTPNGQSLKVSTIEATVDQYGAYVSVSDLLILTAIDNNIVEATELIASQAGRTLDTITREVLSGGLNVIYSGGQISRDDLEDTDVLTVDDIRKAKRALSVQNTEKIDGHYIAIVHPDTVYDIMKDPEWQNAALYAGSTQIFNGEIGRIYGVRFVESTEGKIFKRDDDKSIYSTLVIGKNAYGVTEVQGGGLEHIVKPLGSGGTSDPLNQRSTVGWKALKVAERLVEPYMVRIESVNSTFNSDLN